MRGRFGAWFAVALLSAVVLVGCGKETKKEKNPPTVTQVPVTFVAPTTGPSTPTAATGGATEAATQPASGGQAQAVTVEMVDIAFKPTEFTIPANTDVTVTLKNTGATTHDFSVTDHNNPGVKNLNISVSVDAGQTKTVTINAPAGDYYFYCNVPGHEAAGMHGIMHVKEGASTGGAAEGASSPSAEGASSPAAAASPVAASPEASVAASAEASAVASPASGGLAQTINLDMEDIKFSKDALTIPANTDVTIHLTNTGVTDHDFSIDALKISTGPVAPGKSVDVKINAPAGTYTYYCNIPGHEAAGMKGTLTVTESASAAPGAASPAAAEASPAASPVASPVASTVASPAAAAKTIEVDMEDIKFSTDTLEIPANTDVTIHLVNKGATDHDFSIDALKISTGNVAPGASVDVKINAPAGTYTYYCNIPGHEAAGMKGTLTVK